MTTHIVLAVTGVILVFAGIVWLFWSGAVAEVQKTMSLKRLTYKTNSPGVIMITAGAVLLVASVAIP
jgi:hypothetical protein